MQTTYWKVQVPEKGGAFQEARSRTVTMRLNRMDNHQDTEPASGSVNSPDPSGWADEIMEAAAFLQAGKVVAFPTETVYGLGADARNNEAVANIYVAKGRPSDNPLIVHIANMAQLDELITSLNELERVLMRRFWPGPLTFVLPARPGAVSPRVTAGLPTVAVRMPQHPVALALIAASSCPVAAPSANRSGRPSPTTAAHVRDDLDGRIDGLVDGGPTGVGLESTVIEVVGSRVYILRPGGVSAEQLEACMHQAGLAVEIVADSWTGDRTNPNTLQEKEPISTPNLAQDSSVTSDATAEIALAHDTAQNPSFTTDASEGHALEPGATRDPASMPDTKSASASDAEPVTSSGTPKSPGMKYAHYAPRGEMLLVQASGASTADSTAVRDWIRHTIQDAQRRGEHTGVLTYEEHADWFDADEVVACGRLARLEETAQQLYAALRYFDERGVTFIVAEACGGAGIGAAILNRMKKAAGNRIVQV